MAKDVALNMLYEQSHFYITSIRNVAIESNRYGDAHQHAFASKIARIKLINMTIAGVTVVEISTIITE